MADSLPDGDEHLHVFIRSESFRYLFLIVDAIKLLVDEDSLMEHLEVRFMLLNTLIFREVLSPYVELVRGHILESCTSTSEDLVELHGDILITLQL